MSDFENLPKPTSPECQPGGPVVVGPDRPLTLSPDRDPDTPVQTNRGTLSAADLVRAQPPAVPIERVVRVEVTPNSHTDSLPSPDGEPDGGRSRAARADRQFETVNTETFPSYEELGRIKEKVASVDWLRPATTQSSIAETFGAEDKDSMEGRIHVDPIRGSVNVSRPGIPPERTDEIVDRQLSNYGATLERVREAISATAELAELTEEHAGRTLLTTKYTVPYDPYMPEKYAERFRISIQRGQQGVVIEEIVPSGGRPDEELCHITPSGEARFLKPTDPTTRIRARNDNGALVVGTDEAHRVDATDAEYFKTLSQNLTTYQDLLLRVAARAGFSKEFIGNLKSGQLDASQLDDVNRRIADPKFQVTLPQNLLTNIEVYAHAIANNVAMTSKESLAVRAHRLGGYFQKALSRHGS